jgi:hypothetical protein
LVVVVVVVVVVTTTTTKAPSHGVGTGGFSRG